MEVMQMYLIVSILAIYFGAWCIGRYAGSQLLGGGIAAIGAGLILGMMGAITSVIQHLR